MRIEDEESENPRHSRKAEKHLKTAQQRLSGMKKVSNRRNTARTLLAKTHQKVRRQRHDVHHTVAPSLVRQYETISREDLRVATLVRNRHLAKSISDAGWSQVRSTLAYTAAGAGTHVIVVAPQSTAQMCSGCGERVEKRLAVRTHTGPFCGLISVDSSLWTHLSGLIADRDHNAALNIVRAGQSRRGAVGVGDHLPC